MDKQQFNKKSKQGEPRFKSNRKDFFYCPISPYILWHYGLVYSECPLCEGQRDMGLCARCHLRGNSKAKIRSSKGGKQHHKKDTPKRRKEPIPEIGKTYTSK